MKVAHLLVSLCFLASPAWAQTISPMDAASNVGKKLTVRGVVDEVHTSSRGNIFLNMGGHYPNQAFTGFIRASDASEFANVHAVQGKPASISGTIKLYKGKPEIELQSATQLIAK
jgi:DNA/RNA endonuclease YhcR with UshA esterase domain